MSENLDLQIRNELRKRKMTLNELAGLVGISGPYLSDILNGKRDGQKAQEHINSIKKILNIKSKQEV
ncbi:helix-turn-helix transcriptional regulator [Vagococcus fluvialis]|uniref:helix-turn-helix domain-containing protein n=1 Tax=Vagococcus fluvialis TaxID=2738 RepID=UPI001A8FDEA5|nr:helix-turn-helix transcriptional regulator [Vagococcus fluvialis]MBO0478754.1 helix-turn-helix transcriptional regulator [Vagococcus fluvialis]MBO0484401.1 helix-turn-helix transcriptional regulator [Vagococcus fluvialis]